MKSNNCRRHPDGGWGREGGMKGGGNRAPPFQAANNPPITELHNGEREQEGEKCFSQKKGSPRASVASLAPELRVARDLRWGWVTNFLSEVRKQ